MLDMHSHFLAQQNLAVKLIFLFYFFPDSCTFTISSEFPRDIEASAVLLD